MKRWMLERGRAVVSALELVTRPDLDAFTRTLTERLTAMADQITETLNGVADDLNNQLAPAIDELIKERNELATRNAELEGTEAQQSQAAGRVKSAFDNLGSRFQASPDVPDVEPLPDVPAPDAPANEPAPSEPEQPASDGESAQS